MKFNFALMVKRFIECLHVKILHCSMSEEFPLVGELLMVVIHSQVQSVAWKFTLLVSLVVMAVFLVVKVDGGGGVPGS